MFFLGFFLWNGLKSYFMAHTSGCGIDYDIVENLNESEAWSGFPIKWQSICLTLCCNLPVSRYNSAKLWAEHIIRMEQDVIVFGMEMCYRWMEI